MVTPLIVSFPSIRDAEACEGGGSSKPIPGVLLNTSVKTVLKIKKISVGTGFKD